MQKLYMAVLISPLLVATSFAETLDDRGWPVGCSHVSATVMAEDGYPGNITRISIQPDTVEVDEGCPFVINNPGGHEISTTSTTTWLNGAPTTGNLKLGPANSGKGLFKYEITVKDIGVLDPRARVL